MHCAARSQASATYFPIVMGINVIYLLLCLGKGYESFLNVWSIAGVLSIFGLQYVAYNGILTNAENRNPNDKSLVGGSSLDLLGLTVVVQFGAVLWTPRLYWLLALVPVWGSYSLYSTFAGGGKGSSGGPSKASTSQSTESTEEEDEAMAARRQKRSERRRQKRT